MYRQMAKSVGDTEAGDGRVRLTLKTPWAGSSSWATTTVAFAQLRAGDPVGRIVLQW